MDWSPHLGEALTELGAEALGFLRNSLLARLRSGRVVMRTCRHTD